MEGYLFEDREDAAAPLAEKLARFKDQSPAVVADNSRRADGYFNVSP
jgi:predicted phosphoribosyltransferase